MVIQALGPPVPGMLRQLREWKGTPGTSSDSVMFMHEMHRGDLSDDGIELEFVSVHRLEGASDYESTAGDDAQPHDGGIRHRWRHDIVMGTDLNVLLGSKRIANRICRGVKTHCRVIVTRDAMAAFSDAYQRLRGCA